MAVLSDGDRAFVRAIMMQRITTGFGGITKPDLQSAVNAADSWADANAASFNAALPLPARNALSPQEKSMLLAYVIYQRAGLL